MEKHNKVLKKTIISTITFTIFMTAWRFFMQDQRLLKALLISFLTYLTVGIGFYFIFRWEYKKTIKKPK